jgi:hypothetical protein
MCKKNALVLFVSDYRVDDRGSIPDKGEAFFFCGLYVRTNSEAHLASYTMGTRGKTWPMLDADHSPRSSAEVMAPAWHNGTALPLIY